MSDRYKQIYEKNLINECCQTSHNIYVACFWGQINDREKYCLEKEIFEESGNIISKKKIILHSSALRNMSVQIEDKIGRNFFDNILIRYRKYNSKKSIPVEFYFFESHESLNIAYLKEKINLLLKNSDYFIYITNSNDKTLNIAQMILNNNSLDLIMHGNPGKYPEINSLIDKYKQYIIKNGFDLEDYIVDSSTVIALYGLRESNDLDYLTLGNELSGLIDNMIENHIKELRYHKKTLEELIYNPDNYLYYKGVKFISLECVRYFKANRKEPKDIWDILMIDTLRKRKHGIFLIYARCNYYLRGKYIRGLKNRIRNIVLLWR